MGLFDFLFNKVLVYTAVGDEHYFKAAQCFQSEGLRYKVKSNSGNRPALGQQHINNTSTIAIYDFYVKKEDQHKAQNILSKLRSS
ncbi:hypothetical protein [Bacillus sp. OV322]|uniref:hypothetical protein n=1 Tax=Bacillus sp. OV322 TaxID=1882764 RepID=UPI000B86A9BF|nr:hypothetical protein [Bacillus sp. OV322]